MLYLRWTEQDIADLGKFHNIAVLYTAIDTEGNVKKEIGLDKNGKVVHRAPSSSSNYGIFDNQRVIISSGQAKVSKEVFDNLWKEE